MRPFSSCSLVFVVLGASSLWLLDGKSSFLYAEANMLAWLVVGLLVVAAVILCASLACFCSSFTCSVFGSPSVDWATGVDGSLSLPVAVCNCNDVCLLEIRDMLSGCTIFWWCELYVGMLELLVLTGTYSGEVLSLNVWSDWMQSFGSTFWLCVAALRSLVGRLLGAAPRSLVCWTLSLDATIVDYWGWFARVISTLLLCFY
ncbi:hypothetical protein Peur_004604 [Populus x canadensis]